MRMIFNYADYEDADIERVREMEGIVRENGGRVIGTKASEYDNEAWVVADVPTDESVAVKELAEDAGWELR